MRKIIHLSAPFSMRETLGKNVIEGRFMFKDAVVGFTKWLYCGPDPDQDH